MSICFLYRQEADALFDVSEFPTDDLFYKILRSIPEFGHTHYGNVAYFYFETHPWLNKTFEENISPEYLTPILSHISGQ